MEQNKQTHIVYGVVTGIIMVVVSLSLYLSGLAFKGGGIQYLSLLPLLIGIIMNAMAYSKANDGFVTFGNVFGSGFKMSMIVALVMVAWNVIALFALPEMKTKALEMSRQAFAKNPQMTDEQIDSYMNGVSKYWGYIVVGGGLLSMLFWGALFSLVGGAVAKKKGERPPMSDFGG